MTTINILPLGDSNTRGFKDDPAGYRDDLWGLISKQLASTSISPRFVGSLRWAKSNYRKGKLKAPSDNTDTPEYTPSDQYKFKGEKGEADSHGGWGGQHIKVTDDKRQSIDFCDDIIERFEKVESSKLDGADYQVVLLMAGSNDLNGSKYNKGKYEGDKWILTETRTTSVDEKTARKTALDLVELIETISEKNPYAHIVLAPIPIPTLANQTSNKYDYYDFNQYNQYIAGNKSWSDVPSIQTLKQQGRKILVTNYEPGEMQDNLHPTTEVYEEIAKAWEKSLGFDPNGHGDGAVGDSQASVDQLLLGFGGNDTLTGGAGDDILYGGNDKDEEKATPITTQPTSLGATKDTYVRTDLRIRRNDNYGHERTMNVGTGRRGNGAYGAADAMRSLIQFDVGSVTSDIGKATLQLAVHSFGGGTGNSTFEVEVHRVVDKSWEEGNGAEGFTSEIPETDGVDPADGVAWSIGDRHSENNQAQPSFDSTIVATATVQQGVHQSGDIIEWDITSLVQDWQQNPSSNFGLVLVDKSSEGSVFKELRFGTKEGELYSSIFPDEVAAPKLSITHVNDRLIGNAGDDRLVGGPGADVLTGGPGKDVFRFDKPTEGGDRITDFNRSHGDIIEINAAGFGISTGDFSQFSFSDNSLFFGNTNLVSLDATAAANFSIQQDVAIV